MAETEINLKITGKPLPFTKAFPQLKQPSKQVAIYFNGHDLFKVAYFVQSPYTKAFLNLNSLQSRYPAIYFNGHGLFKVA